MPWVYLVEADFLLIAEDLLGVPAEAIARFPRISGAMSALHAPQTAMFGHEQFPAFEMKAAVLCARLVKNHPLPDGNKRVAFLCLVEFIERNGAELVVENDDELIMMLVGIAAGAVSEEQFAEWIEAHLRRRAA